MHSITTSWPVWIIVGAVLLLLPEISGRLAPLATAGKILVVVGVVLLLATFLH